jgi:hypothetical protein
MSVQNGESWTIRTGTGSAERRDAGVMRRLSGVAAEWRALRRGGGVTRRRGDAAAG